MVKQPKFLRWVCWHSGSKACLEVIVEELKAFFDNQKHSDCLLILLVYMLDFPSNDCFYMFNFFEVILNVLNSAFGLTCCSFFLKRAMVQATLILHEVVLLV